MSLKMIYIIFKKELLESLRDPKVILTNFFMPLLTFPLMAMLTFFLHGVKSGQHKAENYSLLVSPNVPSELVQSFKKDKSLRLSVIDFNSTNRPKLKQQIKGQKGNLYLEMKNNQKLVVHTDTSEQKNLRAWDKVKSHYRSWRKETRKRTPASISNSKFPKIKLSGLVNKGQMAAGMLGGPIGSYILFILVIAVFNPSLNTTIGEREKKTMRITLLTPVTSIEMLVGKILNVTLQGMIGLTPYLLIATGIFYSIQEKSPINIGLLIHQSTLMYFLISTIAITLIIASLCFCIGSFSKSLPQAQSLLSLATFGILLPSVIINVIEINFNYKTAWIPIFNYSLSFKSILLQQVNLQLIVISIVSNLIFAMLCLGIANYFVRKRNYIEG